MQKLGGRGWGILAGAIGGASKAYDEYTEKEVNLIIADFHDDFCTIRRDLIGFDLMERNNGIYKRK